MADYIDMKQVPNGTVTAVDDRILYDYMMASGIIYGCGISYLGNNMIHIDAGYGIIKGGLFEIQDHIEYVEYAENENELGQIYLHFDAAAEDKISIICETNSWLHPMVQDENANFDNGVYEIQLCTFTATTNALKFVTQTFKYAETPIDVIDTLEAIIANTDNKKVAGAKAVKEVHNKFETKLPESIVGFSVGANGSPYITFKRGADSVTKKLGSLWFDLSPYANQNTGNYFTYNVKDYYDSWRELTNANFKVGYVNLGSLSASAYVYALDGGASGGGSGEVGTPSINYNATNGILTVSNLYFRVGASIWNRNGSGSDSASRTISKTDIIVLICED